jgi:hypothetical protein
MEHMSLEESEFRKEHPWCMMASHWDEAKSKMIPCNKPGIAVISTKSGGITLWEDVGNWRTVCAEHYAEHLKPKL